MLGSKFLGQRQFPAGDLHDDGDVVLGAVQLEVIDLHGDGEVGNGIAEHECIFKLAFLIDLSEFGELLVCVVALSISERGIRRGVNGDLHLPEAPILRCVRCVVADNVIVGDGALRLHNAPREIVVVE